MDSAGGPRATNAGAAVPKWAFRAMLDAGYEMPVEEVDYPAGREPPQSEYEVFCLYPRSASLYELAARPRGRSSSDTTRCTGASRATRGTRSCG